MLKYNVNIFIISSEWYCLKIKNKNKNEERTMYGVLTMCLCWVFFSHIFRQFLCSFLFCVLLNLLKYFSIIQYLKIEDDITDFSNNQLKIECLKFRRLQSHRAKVWKIKTRDIVPETLYQIHAGYDRTNDSSQNSFHLHIQDTNFNLFYFFIFFISAGLVEGKSHPVTGKRKREINSVLASQRCYICFSSE